MGSGSSANNPSINLHHTEKAIVKLMFPLYYCSTDITREEHKIASDGWDAILNDKTPEFLKLKGTPGFNYSSCVIFFYDSFYTRLFNVHPMSRNLFKNGMRSQGKFLVKMITLALSEIHDAAKFDKSLAKLATIHNELGVKAVEYGTVGEVLFWVLKKVVGADTYDSHMHLIWVKIYSRMLRVIVPTAVSIELHKGRNHESTVSRRTTDSRMFEDTRSREDTEISISMTSAGEMDHLESEKLYTPTHRRALRESVPVTGSANI